MIKPKALLFSSLLIFAIACRTNKEEKVLKGDEYFPIKIGAVRYYAVDTILYNAFKPSIDTISTEIREEVVEQIVYAPGDTAYRIELSTYKPEKLQYVVFKSFERKIHDNYAIEKLNNIAEVKLLFPIAEYKTKGSSYTWNTNMFNSMEPVMIKYTSVFKSFNNGLRGDNNCVSIKLNKPQTGLVNTIREEVYAKDVGLVYRFTDSTDLLADPTQSHLSGYQVFMKLKP